MDARRIVPFVALSAIAVLCMAPGRCGQSAAGFFSGDPAPDLRGDWDVTYDDSIEIEIDIGGEIVTGNVGGTGGTFEFGYDGETYTFELNCEEPAVVCPSEVFPATVTLEQREFEDRPHQVHMPTVETNCVGSTRLPDHAAGECDDVEIPCDEEICEGMVTETTRAALGSISAPTAEVGDTPEYTFSLALGGRVTGFVTTYGACVGIAGASADANVDYTGTYDPESNNMTATGLSDGEVVLAFGGACFFAGGSGSGAAAAALAGATVTIRTGFEASPQ